MNEQFRIAQKLGLMFRPENPLPEDIKSWAIKQLNAKSPALGVNNTRAKKIQEWPDQLQPDLITRDNYYSEYKYNRKREEMDVRACIYQGSILHTHTRLHSPESQT